MKALSAIVFGLLCSGCALETYPLGVSHSIANKPPYNLLKGTILVTRRASYISRGGADPPQEAAPNPAHIYFLGDQKPFGLSFKLPAATRFLLTDVRHYYAPPDLFGQDYRFDAALLTIHSGPYKGIKTWCWWPDKNRAGPLFVAPRLSPGLTTRSSERLMAVSLFLQSTSCVAMSRR